MDEPKTNLQLGHGLRPWARAPAGAGAGAGTGACAGAGAASAGAGAKRRVSTAATGVAKGARKIAAPANSERILRPRSTAALSRERFPPAACGRTRPT